MRGITKDDALAGNPVFDVLGKTRLVCLASGPVSTSYLKSRFVTCQNAGHREMLAAWTHPMPSPIRGESPSPTPRSQRIVFDNFEAEMRSGELRKNGSRIRLQAQPFQLLALLLRNVGEVVSRDEICRELWPDNTFVDFEHSLAAAVNI